MKRLLCALLALLLCLTGSGMSGLAAGLDCFGRTQTYSIGQYSDVAPSAWYAENVATAYEMGLMKGAGATVFQPEGRLTIAESLALACRLHNIYYGGSGQFTNGVPWYRPYVDYALQNRIISAGYADYERAATRSEFARILSGSLPDEALSVINAVPDYSIPDVDLSAENADAIYRLYRAGILTGNDSVGTFTPADTIERGAAAAIVTRMADPNLRKPIALTAPIMGRLSSTVVWKIAGGTLSVTGAGEIPNFSADHGLWTPYARQINAITVGSGITVVGEYAFAGLKNITALSLPNTLKTIDNWAFCDCAALSTVTLPEGVQILGSGAFYSAVPNRVNLPKTLTWVSTDAFAGATPYTKIYFAGNAPTLGDQPGEHFAFGLSDEPNKNATLYRYDTSYGWTAKAYANYNVVVLASGADSYKPALDYNGLERIFYNVDNGMQALSDAGDTLVWSSQAGSPASAIQFLDSAKSCFTVTYNDLNQAIATCAKYRGLGQLKGCLEAIMAQLAAMKDVPVTDSNYSYRLNEFVNRYSGLGDDVTRMNDLLYELIYG